MGQISVSGAHGIPPPISPLQSFRLPPVSRCPAWAFYIFSGSGYSTPKVSTVMVRIFCSCSGRSE